jgi:ribosome-associated translation inhibitor RaiA
MYATIDQVVDKIDRQVRDLKATENDRRRHGGDPLRRPEE